MKAVNAGMVSDAFKGCTWGNTTESADDWMAILEGDDEIARKRLFKKLFLESSNAYLLRNLFSEDQIRAYLKDYKRPLHRSHLEQRRRVWRFLYLGERVAIPELDWVYRE